MNKNSNLKLQKATEYIENNYVCDLSLEDVVNVCGLNHTTLTKLMKQEKNLTVTGYVTFCRMTAAKKLLTDTCTPIKEIAVLTGYKTVQHFYRVFKKNQGVTPVQYRKNIANKKGL